MNLAKCIAKTHTNENRICFEEIMYKMRMKRNGLLTSRGERDGGNDGIREEVMVVDNRHVRCRNNFT